MNEKKSDPKKEINPKNDFTINLQSQLEKEQDEKDKVIIQLSSINIEIYYYQLCKYSQLIQSQYLKNDAQELLSHDLQLFQKRFNIKDSNIISFFKIIKDENIKITNDQYYDLFRLSELFQVRYLQNILKNYAKQNFNDISFIINSILNEKTVFDTDNTIQFDNFLSHMEDLLSDQIEECFKNEKFGELDISILYRIIFKSYQKKLIQSNLLYEFIRKFVDKRYVLFSFINIQDLSEDNYNDLYNDYIKRENSEFIYNYLPLNLSFIDQLKKDKKEIQSKLDKYENSEQNQTIELQNQIDKLKEENKKLNESQNQLKEVNQKLNESQNQLKEENKKLNESQIQLKEENKQLKDQFEKNHFIIPKFVKKEIKLPTASKDEKIEDSKENELSFDIIKAILTSYEQQIKTKNQNKTLLHLGCESKNIQVVKYILSLNTIDINKEFTENNVTKAALHIAVGKNDIKIVKLLLEQPNINVNIMLKQSTNANNNNSSSEKTPLHIAVENKFTEIVQLLLKHPKIDVNIISRSRTCNNSSDQTSSGSYNNTIEKSALQIAIEKNSTDIIDLLLAHQNIDVNVLFKDTKSESYNNRSNPNNSSNSSKNYIIEKTSLYFAIEKQKIEIALKLLNHPKINANIYSKNNQKSSQTSSSSTQNSNSSYNNNYNNYNTSSTNSSSTTTKEETPLHLAVKMKHIELVHLLLKTPNIDVNLFSKDNSTSGSSSNYQDNYSRNSGNSSSNNKILEKTALHIAVENNSIEIIQLLLAHKNIDVNIKLKNSSKSDSSTSNSQYPNNNSSNSNNGSNESNALYIAVEKKYPEIVQLLIENPSIDVNVILKNTTSTSSGSNNSSPQAASSSSSSNNDSSALLLAIENKDIEIVRILLSNPKINVNIVYKYSSSSYSSNKSNNSSSSNSNSNEKTALFLAVEKQDLEITKLLLTKKDIEINATCKGNNSNSSSIYNNHSSENSNYEKTPLFLAVEKNNTEIVRSLLTQKNIDVNIISKSSSSNKPSDNKCCTSLHLAITNHLTEIIKLLLKNEKVDISIKDNNDKTPIDLMTDDQILNLLSSFNKK